MRNLEEAYLVHLLINLLIFLFFTNIGLGFVEHLKYLCNLQRATLRCDIVRSCSAINTDEPCRRRWTYFTRCPGIEAERIVSLPLISIFLLPSFCPGQPLLSAFVMNRWAFYQNPRRWRKEGFRPWRAQKLVFMHN